MKPAGGGDEEDVQVLVERPYSLSSDDHQQVIRDRVRPYDRRWSPWLVSAATVACVAIFLVTMYVNDCPSHNSNCVAAGFLGRFAFQPFRQNPFLGPSGATLLKMGALDVRKVVHGRQGWRLLTCMWLHLGVVHLLTNMLGLIILGIRLEKDFGFIRIGLIYLISGFGGSLMSALFMRFDFSVGASGALHGLLGSMLSELITNWSLHANKLKELLTLVVLIVVSLALGLLPRVDNFAHIGGLISGFLLGFVFLIRPQLAWFTQQRRVSAAAEAPQLGGQPTTTTAAAAAQPVSVPVPVKRKHKTYQYVLWLAAVVLLVVGFTAATVLLFRGYDANQHCTWCHYLSSSVPTKRTR